jgi:hypothetical protein
MPVVALEPLVGAAVALFFVVATALWLFAQPQLPGGQSLLPSI